MQVDRTAIVDSILMLATLVGVTYCLSVVKTPVPGQIAVIVSLALVHWRLRRSGLTWADLGFRKPPSLWKLPLWVIAAYFIVALANFFVVIPVSSAMGWPAPAFDKLKLEPGNIASLAFFLSIAWTTAAIGEELLFRGFLLHRIDVAFGRNRQSLALSVVLQAVVFGLAHIYLGARGALTAGMVGLVFGVMFVAAKRNLSAAIIAHGLIDTISILALWSGATVT
jgi:uncharacterized protein